MVCKNCQTENPEQAVFCMHCGKRLDSKKICPSCGELCPEEAAFCLYCGKRLIDAPDPEAEVRAVDAVNDETEDTVVTSVKKKTGFEKIKSSFDLSGGICLMAAVLFALVFTLCMGLSAQASIRYSGSGSSFSETTTTLLWDYFGSAYEELADSLSSLDRYSSYFEAANYIPVILSTAVCAGTLICVLTFAIISSVKYGKHFKNPELNYAKPAVAAILSFILGATAFLAINSTSATLSQGVEVSISFSPATLAGIILCSLFLGVYFAFKIVTLGKDFMKAKTIVDFVCTLVGILFLSLTAAFTASPAVNLGIEGGSRAGLNFSNAIILLSNAFDPNNLFGTGYTDFIATYVTSALAQVVQIVLLILAFIALINRIGEFRTKSKSYLGTAIAILSLSAVYLVLTCLALHFGTELIGNTEEVKVSIMAAPIVAFIGSGFILADSITQKVLLKKFSAQN